jgi:predicted metal-dependent phosphoesterase TrpH
MSTLSDQKLKLGQEPATVGDRIERMEQQIAALTRHLTTTPGPESAADAILQRLDQIGDVLMLLAAGVERQNASLTVILSRLPARE